MNGMNSKIDVNELVIKNILNYLKKKNIDYKDFLRELYKLVPQEKVVRSFTKNKFDLKSRCQNFLLWM